MPTNKIRYIVNILPDDNKTFMKRHQIGIFILKTELTKLSSHMTTNYFENAKPVKFNWNKKNILAHIKQDLWNVIPQLDIFKTKVKNNNLAW